MSAPTMPITPRHSPEEAADLAAYATARRVGRTNHTYALASTYCRALVSLHAHVIVAHASASTGLRSEG
jgi:hypothetical protein